MLRVLRHLHLGRRVPFPQDGLAVPCVICSQFSHSGWTSPKISRTPINAAVPKNILESGATWGCNSTAAILFNYQPRRNAGHSKWANIKHVKQANDMARARELTKFLNLMKAAVREHGSADPKQNSRLAQVIAQVKEAKLPMASIDRTLQNLQAKKDNQNCILPIKGPGNCIMLCDLESSNLNKTKQELNTVLRKNKAIVMEDSTLFMFDHKGLLFCPEFNGKSASEGLLDDATAHAIEAGANDVLFHEDHPEFGAVFEFITEPSAFFKVKGALESLKYSVVHAEVAYVPKNYVELADDEVDAASKLYNKLTEHPDVQKVFVNIA